MVRRGRALAALCACLGLAAPAGASTERDETRAAMKQIFASMKVLLPLSTNEERFASPQNRAAVLAALESLAEHADQVAQHAREEDAARRYIGSSLATDARDALERYREGRTESAAFLVQQATENCIACHTRLPSPGDSPLSQHFVDKSALNAMPMAERVRLLVATRQFDEALAAYEALFADPQVSPAEMVVPLTDYLIVAVRVKGDYQRPVPVLQRFARRPDVWRSLRLDVDEWVQALPQLQPLADAPPDLATARRLIDEAQHLVPYPADRRGLVHDVVASSILYRLLEAKPTSKRDQAEAYYLLGVAETQLGEMYWEPQAEVYLETAIRMAPDQPFAEPAFALLEEQTLLAYTGSSGVHAPASVTKHLEELRALVDAGKGVPK
ncbi:MAG TPA: hypothetical protein VMH82_00420 [Myxococcota bacterium]|nr:hypothetical protein [Myxococcota bacterium]